MDEFREDIKVYIPNDLTDDSRILLSSGVTQVTPSSYCQNSFIPQLPWRQLNDSESLKLLTKSKPVLPSGKWVSITKIINEEIIERLRGIGFGDTVVNREKYDELVSLLLNSLSSHIHTYDDLHVHSVKIDPPGLRTVTFSPEVGCLIGLHLDSWDKLSMNKTQFARNRVCINLGPEPRYLLFFNLDLVTMLNILNLTAGQLEGLRESAIGLGREVGHLFMQYESDYPVVRLKINPGEAYIAPTENTFHDGCTEENTEPTANIMIRGYFSP